MRRVVSSFFPCFALLGMGLISVDEGEEMDVEDDDD